MQLDLNYTRNKFPALKQDFVFMDNAGGSQVLGSVVSRISDYLINHNVQLGASYEVSSKARAQLSTATKMVAELINANDTQEVIIGSSTTMLLRILSLCLSKQWQEGDEVIVTNSDHEANVSCWMDLREKGIVVKTWKVNSETLEFDLDDLKALMNSRTKLVTMVHASNVLGTINPIKEISKAVHEAGALFCVDGVAFAPHRRVDVQEFEADFYVFSWYKVFGPHQAVLYGKLDLLEKMDGINHYFVDEIPYKFQPGNFNYELTYSLTGISEHLCELHDHHFPNESDFANKIKFQKAFELIANHEEKLAERLLAYLNTNNNIRIIGHKQADKSKRVATVSFVHDQMTSSEIVEKIDSFKIGIRFGDFYAKKLIIDLGLERNNGVVRVSLAHYNTLNEVDRLVKAFETVL